MRRATAAGTDLIVERAHGRMETHACRSVHEASQRADVINEGLSWLGTPFRDCADIKGGGVDCAMTLVRTFVDTGTIAPFDPRPYPPQWHLHQNDERFKKWITETHGARLVDSWMPGNVILFRFGRCYSHGALILNSVEFLHAYAADGMVTIAEKGNAAVWFNRGKQRELEIFDLWDVR